MEESLRGYKGPKGRRQTKLLGWCVLMLTTGCQASLQHQPPRTDLPHELEKVVLPPYVIEAPDVLLIDAIRVVPKPPYRISPLDVLGIQVDKPLPNQPITGVYQVESDGAIN